MGIPKGIFTDEEGTLRLDDAGEGKTIESSEKMVIRGHLRKAHVRTATHAR